MGEQISRRRFLRGTLAGAVVIAGFDTGLRSWVSAAELERATALAEDFPTFDGVLLLDQDSRDAAADDFGHLIHREPLAVLKPGSVDDVIKLIQFARRNDIKVAARGQGHSTQGQAQVEAGVVVDMATLATVHEINPTNALVDGGTRWLDLLTQTIPQGLTPPTLVDFLELTVGGTVSLGGIGSQAFRHGPNVDNVLELQVVTGEGELMSCSATHNTALFDAARSGLGQFGLIVRARVRLIPAPPNARLYHAFYSSLPAFLSDLEKLIDDGRFDTVQGFAVPDGAGSWLFQLETAKYFSPGDEPDDAGLLSGLAFNPGTQSAQDMTYFDYLNRLAPLVALLRQIGVWAFPHPWVNLFVPAANAQTLIGETLATLTVDDVGQGPILIYPFNRELFRAPFFRVPNSRHFFIFSLLRNAVPPTPERAAQLVAANRTLFERATTLGGKRYPFDSVPMTRHDWQKHYQPLWGAFVSAKRHFDPDEILTPGQGI
ncbi:MAG TPA: FAD-binding protein, partial [Pyrinomonadaceae bacterium]|nr:FAD-binding protein [Pyrinomonadaceae bacterium]